MTDFVTGFRGNLQLHVCLFYLSSLLAPEMEIHWTMCILNIDWKEIKFCLRWWEILSWTSKKNCLLSGLHRSSKESLKLSLSHFSKFFIFSIFSLYSIIYASPFLSPSPSPDSLISPFIILLWTWFFTDLLKIKKVKIKYFILIKIQVL